ncbi:fibronectin type III domain-containing protein [Aureispira anguillae]|uniref:Fibronectin type III domain-containing protein n=1 Tax=Aureispira anguillae TaxID=2864201 RepID=A0A915YIJ1_9BACT|nr:fibronectin type III domain-containing protein [Aureispira anguillae]BDS13814.1 fibronectin type III domain-containing protein [Aureispira anguillae]
MKEILMFFLAYFLLSTLSYAQPCPGPVTPTYSEDFTTFLDPCWSEAQGRLATSTSLSGTSSSWTSDGFANSGSTGAAKINLYGTSADEWLLSPSIDLGTAATSYQLEFDIALTDWNNTSVTTLGADDTIAVVISTDNGATWEKANILQHWLAGSEPSHTGERIVINLAAYTGLVKIGFYTASSSTNADNDVFIDNFVVTNLASCAAPSALTATNITSTSVDFSWTENGTATSWEVEYGAQGFTQGSGTAAVTSNNPESIAALSANTSYDFYVRAICGAGDSSAWVGPFVLTTPCPTSYTPTYSEDFTTFLDACWSEAQGRLATSTTLTGTTSSWTNDGFSNAGTTGAARMEIYSTTRDEWLISPSIDLGTAATSYQLEFDIALTHWNSTAAGTLGADDTIAVVISTDNGATWEKANILQHWLAGGEPSTTGDHIVINLSAYTGVVKFGFYAASSVSNEDNNVYIDNFLVTNLASCAAPSALTASNITTTTADLAWTENGTATSWQIEYGALGFTQGTGTTALAGSNPHNQTGLMPSSDYQFYVRAICGAGDSSAWAGPFNFQTACGAIVAPWTESFSGGLPNCWTDRGNDAYIFNTSAAYGAAVAGDYTAGGGTNYAWVDGSGATGTFDTLTTPLIDISGLATPHLCFGLFSNNINDAGNNTIMIEFFDGAAWNLLATFQQNLGPAWAPLSYDLSSYTVTGNTQVRFIINTNSTGDAYNNDILIDEVSMNNGGCPQFCIAPSALGIANLLQTTVDLNWTENGAATSWQVEYGAQGFAQGSGTAVVTATNPHSLTGLTDNTSYDFYVRAICGGGDSSLWVGPFNFTTLANCPFPSALTATNITPTSADLGWTENGTATSWQVEYGTQGFAQGSGTAVVTGNNPENITALASNTNYSFYVRAICGAGDSSAWVGPFNFATPCALVPGDTPDDAIMVTSLPYSTTGKTDSCYMDSRGNASADVWYQYILAPCTDSLTVSLCGSAFDTYLRIFASDTTTQIFFNDDNCSTRSEVVIDVTASSAINPGDTIFILVEGYSSNEGAYNLNISDVVQCPPPPYYHIDQINSVDTNGVADSLGVIARIRGVVHCIDFRAGTGLEFFLAEYNNTGIKVFDFADVNGYAVTEGDSLEVWGTVSQFNGHLQFDPDSIVVVSSGNPLVMPTTVSQLSEATENKFVDFQNAWLVDPAQWTGSGSGFNVDVTNGTDTILVRVDNATNLYAQPAPTGIFHISGWGGQFDSSNPHTEGYQLFPCGIASVVPYVEDVAVTAFLNLDSTYCNVATVSGSVIITNMTANNTDSIPYTITANGIPLVMDTILMLNGNASDTITVGPISVSTTVAVVQVTTALNGDVDATNDTLAMTVSISNTAAAASVTATILCNNDSTGEVTAMASNGIGAYNYAWDANAGNATTAVVPNLPAGAYTVIVTDSIGCTDTASVTLTEPTALNASIVDNGDGTAVAVGTGGTPSYTFAWDAAAGNQTTDTATALVHNGTYVVTITDANGCTDTSSVVINFIGVQTIANLSSLNLFPNPTTHNAFVALDLVEQAEVQINIINSIGQVVESKNLGTVQSETVELNTAALASGIYMVQFNIGQEQVTRKLIVSKQ